LYDVIKLTKTHKLKTQKQKKTHIMATTKKHLLFTIVTILLMTLLPYSAVNAAQLTNASLELGDPRTSNTSTYTVSAASFTTATAIACVEVVLNDQADGGGSIPSGITTTSSTYDSSSLLSDGNWVVNNPGNGTFQITNGVTTETPSASGNIVWGSITNGDTEGTVYYAIITTYTDSSCTGGNEVDTTTVAYIYNDGEPIQLAIDPTLTFSVNAVGTSQAVNGATTTHATTASGIDYGTSVNALANGISAHDLTVTTNATGGYVVYIRHSDQLTNSESDTIDNFSGGTNLSPQSFSGAGTEAWGYTTEDSTLSSVGDGVDRFTTPANQWAGFSTSNAEVMVNAAAVPGSETHRVGHQVAIATTTDSGTYTNEILYTVVATF
jgi:hypothetical protein